MAVPSRKNRMMQKIISNQDREKEKLKAKEITNEITPEEHEDRIKKLRKLGLIK